MNWQLAFPKTLVVEDDPNAAFLLQSAFKSCGLRTQLSWVSDGEEALDYLRGKQLVAQVASSTLPGLLLLDLNLPRRNGFEVLEWLRAHPHLRPGRVVVLGEGLAAEEADRAQALGADHFLAKPQAGNDFGSVVEELAEFLGQPPVSAGATVTAARSVSHAA